MKKDFANPNLSYIHSDAYNILGIRKPHNKKEAAMIKLRQRNYVVAGLFQELTQLRPSDCSDWNEEEKNLFRETIFEKRKNLHDVSKVMGKSVNECIIYYLSYYKHTADYYLLKTIRTQELNDKYVTEKKENNESSQKGKSEDKDHICLVCGGKKSSRRHYMDPLSGRQHQQNLVEKNLDKEFREMKVSLLENANKCNSQISKKRKTDSLGAMNHSHDEKDGTIDFYNNETIVGGMLHDASSCITENESKNGKDPGLINASSEILALRKFASSISFINGHERK